MALLGGRTARALYITEGMHEGVTEEATRCGLLRIYSVRTGRALPCTTWLWWQRVRDACGSSRTSWLLDLVNFRARRRPRRGGMQLRCVRRYDTFDDLGHRTRIYSNLDVSRAMGGLERSAPPSMAE